MGFESIWLGSSLEGHRHRQSRAPQAMRVGFSGGFGVCGVGRAQAYIVLVCMQVLMWYAWPSGFKLCKSQVDWVAHLCRKAYQQSPRKSALLRYRNPRNLGFRASILSSGGKLPDRK